MLQEFTSTVLLLLAGLLPVINPPAANKHGFWTSNERPAKASDWLAAATRHEGSWWPTWIQWLTDHGSKKSVAARAIEDGIEPAPGRYAMMK